MTIESRAKVTAVACLFLLLAFSGIHAADREVDVQNPPSVIEAYLRAVYARDFAAAYRFISSADRQVRDLNRYLQQRGPFSGFTLELARNLSASLEITVSRQQVNETRAQAEVRYRLPDPTKLAPLVLDWNAHRLNSLSLQERKSLIDSVEKLRRAGSLPLSEGTEKFQLVREANGWRIFLDWAAGVRIPFRLDLSKATGLEATLDKDQVILQPGDLFRIELTLRNRAEQPVTARVGHLVEPTAGADYLDFVECGFLRPVALGAGEERRFSGTYMLRGSLPDGIGQLRLTYDFRLLK
jgi:hypothetical protein